MTYVHVLTRHVFVKHYAPQHMLAPKDSLDIIFCHGQITEKTEEQEL